MGRGAMSTYLHATRASSQGLHPGYLHRGRGGIEGDRYTHAGLEPAGYPNPTATELFISGLPDEVDEALVYNSQGQQVLREPLSFRKSISVATLEPGLYVIRLSCGTDQYRLSFIKE